MFLASKKSQNPRALLLIVVMKKDAIERTHSVLLVLVLSRITFIKWLILMMLILVETINYRISVVGDAGNS